MAQLRDEEEDLPEPRQLRGLRWLVSGLLIVLILATIAIAAVIVIRLGFGWNTAARTGLSGAPIVADRFPLPKGVEVEAVGRGGGGDVMFVLRREDGQRVLQVFDPETGLTLSTTELGPTP